MAIGVYDRTRTLFAASREATDGIEFVAATTDESTRGLLEGRFDAGESSLATYVRAFEDDVPIVALASFPHRKFFQQYAWVRRGGPVRTLGDLRGRRVLVPMYWMTSSVWHRMMLRDEHGIEPADVEWAVLAPDRLPSMRVPPGVSVRRVESSSWTAPLLSGEVDCLLTAATTPEILAARDGLERPFEDVGAAQREWYRKTGIFPPVHVLVVRRESLERDPALAPRLLATLGAARFAAYVTLEDECRTSLPLLRAYLDDSHAAFGNDPYPDGLEANRFALEAFLEAAHRQGLTERRLRAEDAFVDVPGEAGTAG